MQSGLDFETWETTNLNRAPLNRKRGAPHPRRVLVIAEEPALSAVEGVGIDDSSTSPQIFTALDRLS